MQLFETTEKERGYTELPHTLKIRSRCLWQTPSPLYARAESRGGVSTKNVSEPSCQEGGGSTGIVQSIYEAKYEP